jgi:hypothetical protein
VTARAPGRDKCDDSTDSFLEALKQVCGHFLITIYAIFSYSKSQ